MKLTITLFALAAFTFVGSAYAATTVSYTTYTATSSTDTSWVSPVGSTSVKAVNFGGEETTYGGVTWLTGNPSLGTYNDASTIQMYFSAPNVAWGNNASSEFYSGGPSLLASGVWSAPTGSGNVPFQLDMAGFTVGQAYQVQFILADTRDLYGQTVSIQNYSANISASAPSPTIDFSYADGRYAVITASFTPGVGDTTFTFRPMTDGGTGMQLNAVQVLAVPEPSTALLGALGMLALLRRRR